MDGAALGFIAAAPAPISAGFGGVGAADLGAAVSALGPGSLILDLENISTCVYEGFRV